MENFSTSEIKEIRPNHVIEFKNGATYSVPIGREQEFLIDLLRYHRNSSGHTFRRNRDFLLYYFDNG